MNISPAEIFDLIVCCTRDVLPDLALHDIQPQDRLAELGANSTDRAEIVVSVLESLALDIPRVQLFGPRTLGELAQLLHEKMYAH